MTEETLAELGYAKLGLLPVKKKKRYAPKNIRKPMRRRRNLNKYGLDY